METTTGTATPFLGNLEIEKNKYIYKPLRKLIHDLIQQQSSFLHSMLHLKMGDLLVVFH